MLLIIKAALTASAVLVICLLPSLNTLYKGYRVANRVGLPIFLTPFGKFNPIWSIIGPPLVFPLLRSSPLQFMRDWAMFGDYGFAVWDRGDVHKRRGTAFLVVSPGSTTLVTDDPKATEDVLRRTNVFVKPRVIYENIEWFGPNVDSVNGQDWQRHRRLTTPPFNERNSGLVWRESLKQAEGMIARWEKHSLNGVEVAADTMKLALHVLTSAGFGKTYHFAAGTSEISKGHKLSYKDALAHVLSDTLTAILAIRINGPVWLLPKKWTAMKYAMAEFRQYMVEMVEEQRSTMHEKKDMQQDNLMSALVRANEVSRGDGKERYSLNDDELLGNLFIWNLAGHDTTATTLAYTFTALSAHRSIQDRIAEEVEAVFGDTPVSKWDYESTFPRLPRCLATMYEALRLYGPVPHMAKQTETPQTLEISGKEYELPANYHLTLNLYAIHLNKQYWGADADDFKPSRFIQNDELVVPGPSGAFLPWVNGPRVCPGKKFAQVEFVATLALCLLRHRVSAVAEPGEAREQTSLRALAVARDSEMGPNPVVKMKHPERVRFRWEEI